MGGDFNFCMVPGYDSTSGAQRTENVQRRLLTKKLTTKKLHQNQHGNTFYSSVHETYSRIDFFLVEHRLLETVTNMNIEISAISDHAPVTMRITI